MYTPEGFRPVSENNLAWGAFDERIRSLVTLFLVPNPRRPDEAVGFVHTNLAGANGIFDTHSGPYGVRSRTGGPELEYWSGAPGRYDRWNAQFLNYGFEGNLGVAAVGMSTLLTLFTRDALGVVPVRLNLASGDWHPWSGAGWQENITSGTPLPHTSGFVPQGVGSISGTDSYLAWGRWGTAFQYSLLRLVTTSGAWRWEALNTNLSTWRQLVEGAPPDVSLDIKSISSWEGQTLLFGNSLSRDNAGEPVWTATVMRYDVTTGALTSVQTLPGEEMLFATANAAARYVVTRKASDGPRYAQQKFYLRSFDGVQFGVAARFNTLGDMEGVGRPSERLEGLVLIGDIPTLFVKRKIDAVTSVLAVAYGATERLLSGVLPPSSPSERLLPGALGQLLTEFHSEVRMEVFDPDNYPPGSGDANRTVSFFSPYGRQPCTDMQFLPNNRLLCTKGITTGVALLDPLGGGPQSQWGAMWDLTWFPFAAALDPRGGRVFVSEEATTGGTGSQHPNGLISVWDYARQNESLGWRAQAPLGTFMDRQRCYQPQRILDMDPNRSGEQRLNYPSSMWFDTATQILYVAEAAAHQIRRFELSAAAPTTIIRELLPLGSGALSCPMGLTLDREGNLLIGNMCGNNIVRMSLNGDVLQRIGSPGSGTGQLYYPGGVAEDPRTGRIFVSDTGNRRIVVFGSNGEPVDYFNTVVLPNGIRRQLNYPGALAVNQEGVLAIDNSVNKYLVLLR
jgi:hypothetical protein